MPVIHALFQQSERRACITARGLLIQFHSLGTPHWNDLINNVKRKTTFAYAVGSIDMSRAATSVGLKKCLVKVPKFTKSMTNPIEEIRQDRL